MGTLTLACTMIPAVGLGAKDALPQVLMRADTQSRLEAGAVCHRKGQEQGLGAEDVD